MLAVALSQWIAAAEAAVPPKQAIAITDVTVIDVRSEEHTSELQTAYEM